MSQPLLVIPADLWKYESVCWSRCRSVTILESKDVFSVCLFKENASILEQANRSYSGLQLAIFVINWGPFFQISAGTFWKIHPDNSYDNPIFRSSKDPKDQLVLFFIFEKRFAAFRVPFKFITRDYINSLTRTSLKYANKFIGEWVSVWPARPDRHRGCV